MKKNKKKNVIIIIAILCLIGAVLFVVFEKNSAPRQSDDNCRTIYTEQNSAYAKQGFMLKNERGTYSYAEVVYPRSIEEKATPMVFIAHGFRGTINSGGAKELCERFASDGITAVRIDFNNRLAPDKEAETTDDYTLQTMMADGVSVMDYVVNNYNIDTDRIGIYGRSMGGRVAMTMANESKGNYDFKALMLIAPAGNKNAMIYYMGGKDKWDEMKKTAARDGFCPKQGLKLKPEWFEQFEDYDPSSNGDKFGDKPVFVIYNTLDRVVLPSTSIECAEGYSNSRIMEVTTEDGHGHEMSFKESALKEKIMNSVVEFFKENL